MAAYLRQRRRSESALRASEERFRATFHQAAVGAAEVNLKGEMTMLNDRCCQVLGHKREQLLGKTLDDVTHPDDRAALLEARRQLLAADPAPCVMELRTIRGDGGTTWVRLHESMVHVGSGPASYSIAMVEDITERREAEAALQESEKRFRNMADTCPVMIWVTGPDKLFTFFNQVWLTFTGLTMDQAYGRGWMSTAHPDELQRLINTFVEAFDARKPFHMERRLRRADGEYRWVLSAGVPRFESGGAFAGYVGSCIDITDVKRTQQQLLATQKLESLGVLAGGIAHDFNNLLGSIRATSELVLSDLPGDSPASCGMEAITKVADRAAGIVRQMMVYAGQEHLDFEPVDLSRLVGEMLDLLRV
jgi:PAS domain S-box-containing protein